MQGPRARVRENAHVATAPLQYSASLCKNVRSGNKHFMSVEWMPNLSVPDHAEEIISSISS
jgi:hypothetical protein